MTAHGSYNNSPISLQAVPLPRRPATVQGMHEPHHPHYSLPPREFQQQQWREAKDQVTGQVPPVQPMTMNIAQLQAQAEFLEMEARMASEEAQKLAEQQFRQMFDSKGVRVTHACEHCRQRKAKCTGTQPCKRCTKQGRLCTFSKIEKKRKVTASLRELAGMHERPVGMMPWDDAFSHNQRRYAPRGPMQRYGSDTPPQMARGGSMIHGHPSQIGTSPSPSVYGTPSVLDYHEPMMMMPPPTNQGNEYCDTPMIPSNQDLRNNNSVIPYYPPAYHHHLQRNDQQGGVAMNQESIQGHSPTESARREENHLLSLPPMSHSMSAQSSPLSPAPSLPA